MFLLYFWYSSLEQKRLLSKTLKILLTPKFWMVVHINYIRLVNTVANPQVWLHIITPQKNMICILN